MTEKHQTHIVFLAETKEAADLGRALRAQSLRQHGIRDTWDIRLALLDDAQRKHGQVHAHDAAAHTLPLTLASAAGPVARVAVGEQQAHTRRVHDTLLHRETLLVVATGDLEDVALELVADAVAGDFLAHAAVHEDADLALIFDVDELLRAVRGEGDVELHLDGELSRWRYMLSTSYPSRRRRDSRLKLREGWLCAGGTCRGYVPEA